MNRREGFGEKLAKWFRKDDTKTEEVIDLTLAELRYAIHEYERTLPKGVNRTVLLHDTQEIDTTKLKHHLKGTPRQRFFMSKETFHIVPESERDVVYEMDQVQRALDLYMDQGHTLPLRKLQDSLQLDLTKLRDEGYLKILPKRPYYVVDESLIVSLEAASSTSTHHQT